MVACVLFQQEQLPKQIYALPGDYPAGMFFLMTSLPFIYAATRVAAVGLSTSRYASSTEKMAVRHRIFAMMRKFPFSSLALIAVVAYPSLVLINGEDKQRYLVAWLAWFNAVTLFICVRLCLTRVGLQFLDSMMFE